MQKYPNVCMQWGESLPVILCFSHSYSLQYSLCGHHQVEPHVVVYAVRWVTACHTMYQSFIQFTVFSVWTSSSWATCGSLKQSVSMDSQSGKVTGWHKQQTIPTLSEYRQSFTENQSIFTSSGTITCFCQTSWPSNSFFGWIWMHIFDRIPQINMLFDHVLLLAWQPQRHLVCLYHVTSTSAGEDCACAMWADEILQSRSLYLRIVTEKANM